MSTESPGQPPGRSNSRYVVAHDAGEVIFAQGDSGDEMYIVHEGVVEIFHDGPNGRVELARLEKGDFFGEMALLEALPRSASARAVTPVELVRVDSATFDKILRRDPEIAVRIMRKLSHRLRETDEHLRAVDVAAPAESGGEPDGESGAGAPPHHLSHPESGIRFPLPGREAIVGRHDPVTNSRPAVDLTPIDPERSSSRRHARIYGADGELFLVEEIGTTNGTYLNDVRVETGRPLRIAAGDRLRFGLVELLLVAGE